MFDLGGFELLIIGIVALLVMGDDFPTMFRKAGQFTGKMRKMAREFSRAMEEAADDAGVKDVTNTLKTAASPKNMGIDSVKRAADSFEKWEAGAGSKRTSKPAAKPAAGTDAATDAKVEAEPGKSSGSKSTARKPATAKKTAARKAPAKSATAKKTTATASAAKKPAAKATSAKKPAAKKPAAKKSSKSTGSGA